jgi:RNA binding exosome subunit
MARNTVIKIDLILHATEDFQKVTDPLNDLFAIEREEITKQELSGHFGNPILMLHTEIKKKRADQFIKKLVSLIPKDTMNELLTKIEEHIFGSTLYIRFSKQNLVKKILAPEEKDPVRIAIYTPTYVKKEIPNTYRKLLNENNDMA